LNSAWLACSTAATPSAASHINTWSPPITPNVAAAPARNPPFAVAFSSANVPGPGSARKTSTAATKAQ
jgi:hypothetical protein